MSTSIDRPLIGVEAQRIFLELRDHAAAYDLIQDVVSLTHAIHVGRDASALVDRSITALQVCGTVEEIDAVFAQSREQWAEAGFGAMLSAERRSVLRNRRGRRFRAAPRDR